MAELTVVTVLLTLPPAFDRPCTTRRRSNKRSCWTFRGSQRVNTRLFNADNLLEKRLLTQFDNPVSRLY
jgi:hypothetical protein